MLLLICLLLAAPAPPSHRAKAERAEALGHMQEAAREYEAAFDEEQAPDLLYRLGVTRRKLKQYARAREAFRAYLRVAPDGGLREEVERQLAKLDVLIEAQAEDFSGEEKPRKAPPPISAPQAAAPPAPISAPPAISAPTVPAAPPAATSAPSAAISAPPEAAVAPPAAISAPPEAVVAPPAAISAPVVPPAAISAPPEAVVVPPPRSRAAPWLAAGAVVAAGAGAYLWWDGSRVARDLDTRYAAGDLTAGDRPLFGRARGESIAGRALVAAGAGLLAGAVALWW